MRVARRRIWAGAGIGLAVTIGLVALATAGDRYERGGPLATLRETRVTTHASPGQLITWGTVLPTNATDHDIVIESIEPIAPVTGLTIVALGVSDPRNGAVGTSAGYPPAGVAPRPIAGTVLSPRDGGSPFVQVVLGVRLDDPAGGGRVDGLRIRYATNGRRYETVLLDRLVVERFVPSAARRHGTPVQGVVGPDAGRSLGRLIDRPASPRDTAG